MSLHTPVTLNLSPAQTESDVRLLRLKRPLIACGLGLVLSAALFGISTSTIAMLEIRAHDQLTYSGSNIPTSASSSMNELNSHLRTLAKSAATNHTVSDLVITTTDVIPSGVTISAWTFDARANTITIHGNSLTRDALIEFRSALDDIPTIIGATLPLSALVPKSDINFDMTLALAATAKTP